MVNSYPSSFTIKENHLERVEDRETRKSKSVDRTKLENFSCAKPRVQIFKVLGFLGIFLSRL